MVDTQEYGRFQPYAYNVKAWKEAGGKELEQLLEMLPKEAREDFETGRWMFGRGVSDMKGGLGIGLALMDWYGQMALENPGLPGNLLFAAVADEEGYSAGMRGSVSMFTELAKEYGLNYACLLDLEPGFIERGRQQVYIGSVGKIMPSILVQGIKAHVVDCFQGLNPVGALAEMFMRTELSPEFSEVWEGEACPPPTWFNLRDRKEGYDVSLPLRAGGYMSVLGFTKTADSVMARLKAIGGEAFSACFERMGRQAAAVYPTERWPGEKWEYQVLEYRELAGIWREKFGEEKTGLWMKELYKRVREQVRTGNWNYPQASLEMMDELLTYSGITGPVMVISFAPPYYPAFHSDGLSGQEGAGTRLYRILEKSARKVCGLELNMKNYFCEISDLSYCRGPDEKELRACAGNMPLWGNMYSMDVKSMGQFQVPAMLFGPVGRDIHQMSERVNARSLLEEVPEILQDFIEQVFAKDPVV